jgi:allophanate hydrolase
VPSIVGPVPVAAALAEPIAENARLGYYTNFVNLLDLCALAVPGDPGDDGLPRGVTLIAPAGHDGLLAGLGDALHHQPGRQRGATGRTLGPLSSASPPPVRLVVAGAHLEGMPLNHQLTTRGARLLQRTRTAPRYRLFALSTEPPKPGLVQTSAAGEGAAIEVEVWALSAAALGEFLSALPAPMCLGRVELEDGESVTGFLCEPYAIEGARDISALGGWRAYVRTRG